MKKTLLWLDDIRKPIYHWLIQYAPEYLEDGGHVVWVKSYDEFIEWITKNGLPDEIGFDHDLGHEVVDNFDNLGYNPNEKTGYDCAKWCISYCMDNEVRFPKYFVQSANPTGKSNIISYIENFKKNCQY